MTKRRMAVLAGAFACTLALPASAQTIGYGDSMKLLIEACSADVEKHCASVRIGSGRIEACLQQNVNSLSQNCVTTYNAVVQQLQVRAAAQEAVPKVCEADAKRLCEDFRAGRARFLRCLIREDNTRKVSNACNKAITDAGWR
jgi:nitrate/nitrite-specific signal transduction histidine kinase